MVYKGVHEKMIVWQNICELNKYVLDIIAKISKYEFKVRSQIINADDSIASNFVEGYYSGHTKEYIRFLNYSRRSGAELHERIRRLYIRRIIEEIVFNKFEDLCVRTMYLIDKTRNGLEKYVKEKKQISSSSKPS